MKMFKRIAAGVSSAVFIINLIVVCSAAQYATINITASESSRISYRNIYLTRQSGRYGVGSKTYNENAYFVEAKPNDTTSFVVTSGKSIYGRSTLSKKTANYNPGQGKRVVAAINGDFFSSKTGLPLGVQISDGVIQATNNYEYELDVHRYSVAFREDGSAFIDIPHFNVGVSVNGHVVTADRLNAYPSANLTLLTDDYSDKTYWETAYSHDVIVLKGSGKMRVDVTADCEFVGYYKGVTEPLAIEENHFYLIAPAGDTRLAAAAAGAAPGAPCNALVSDLTGKWKNVKNSVGGGNLLINNGTLRYTSTYDSAISGILTSRSALGIKADGTVVLYAVEKDAKAAVSGGVKLEAVAQALYNMGCIYAVNLDGGGSTTLSAAESGSCSVINSCQDGSERGISNCLMIVSRETAPEIITDLDNKEAVNEIYSGKSLINASYQSKNVYTGTNALQADCRFAGDVRELGFDFDAPYDISKYSNIVFAVCGDGKGGTIAVKLENAYGTHSISVGNNDFIGWRHFQLSTENASRLVGFSVINPASNTYACTVLFDRVVGYDGDFIADYSAPTLYFSQNGQRVIVNAHEMPYDSGIDYQSLKVSVDGNQYPVYYGVADISSVTGGQIRRAFVEGTDIFGNRAKKTLLILPDGYNAYLPYSDVRPGGWDELYIRYCTEAGIIDGFTENNTKTFRGSQMVTRAQFCTMLVRKRGIDARKYAGVTLPYEDLYDIPGWAMLYIKAAYAEGIMLGSKTDTGVAFNARAYVSRQEAAVAVNRLYSADSRLAMLQQYTDETAISGWAHDAVMTLTACGVLDGDSDKRFYPVRSLSRSEAATIMTRI